MTKSTDPTDLTISGELQRTQRDTDLRASGAPAGTGLSMKRAKGSKRPVGIASIGNRRAAASEPGAACTGKTNRIRLDPINKDPIFGPGAVRSGYTPITCQML